MSYEPYIWPSLPVNPADWKRDRDRTWPLLSEANPAGWMGLDGIGPLDLEYLDWPLDMGLPREIDAGGTPPPPALPRAVWEVVEPRVAGDTDIKMVRNAAGEFVEGGILYGVTVPDQCGDVEVGDLGTVYVLEDGTRIFAPFSEAGEVPTTGLGKYTYVGGRFDPDPEITAAVAGETEDEWVRGEGEDPGGVYVEILTRLVGPQGNYVSSSRPFGFMAYAKRLLTFDSTGRLRKVSGEYVTRHQRGFILPMWCTLTAANAVNAPYNRGE